MNYLEYLESISPAPENADRQVMRDFICYIQKEHNLSDRTINCCISQLRFFTFSCVNLTRAFHMYLPYVPSRQEVSTFISTMPDLKEKAMVPQPYISIRLLMEPAMPSCVLTAVMLKFTTIPAETAAVQTARLFLRKCGLTNAARKSSRCAF